MFEKKSLLEKFWKLEIPEERFILSSSQKNKIPPLLAQLLLIRNIKDEEVEEFLNPNIKKNLPDPFLLIDMDKSVNRVIDCIKKKQKIGIIADYDVDGSTSASILFKFLSTFTNNIIILIPGGVTGIWYAGMIPGTGHRRNFPRKFA